MRILVFILGLLVATSAFAQDAVVTADAPIYVRPDSAKPIRTAAVGTVLRVVAEEGEWVQVQFHDPQWGPRTGWVRAGLVDIPRPETTPMDLSIRSRGTTPSPVASPATDPVFTPRRRPLERSPFRVHTLGRAGATFGTATAALAGVEFSGDVLPMLQVYGGFDWHQDLIPKDIDNAFSLLGDLLGVDLDLKVPTYVGIGGVKVIAPSGAVRPYGLGGFGISHSRGKVIVDGEDQTQLILDLAGLEKSDISFTKPIAEGGGGIVIPAGRAYFDVGYRFRKVIDAEGINVSGVYFGAGFSY